MLLEKWANPSAHSLLVVESCFLNLMCVSVQGPVQQQTGGHSQKTFHLTGGFASAVSSCHTNTETFVQGGTPAAGLNLASATKLSTVPEIRGWMCFPPNNGVRISFSGF